MDSGQCSGTGSLLSLRGSGTVATLGAGQNSAGGEDENVAVGELLLELTGETAWILDMVPKNMRMKGVIPLLHLVEAWKGWDGDKDDNCLLAVANFNLNSDQSQHAISMFRETMVRSPPESTTETPTHIQDSNKVSPCIGICMV